MSEKAAKALKPTKALLMLCIARKGSAPRRRMYRIQLAPGTKTSRFKAQIQRFSASNSRPQNAPGIPIARHTSDSV